MADTGPRVWWELGKMAQCRILDLISTLAVLEVTACCATVPLSLYWEYFSISDYSQVELQYVTRRCRRRLAPAIRYLFVYFQTDDADPCRTGVEKCSHEWNDMSSTCTVQDDGIRPTKQNHVRVVPVADAPLVAFRRSLACAFRVKVLCILPVGLTETTSG